MLRVLSLEIWCAKRTVAKNLPDIHLPQNLPLETIVIAELFAYDVIIARAAFELFVVHLIQRDGHNVFQIELLVLFGRRDGKLLRIEGMMTSEVGKIRRENVHRTERVPPIYTS